MNKIFVTVSGGCAYVMEDTVPQGFTVEVIDSTTLRRATISRLRRHINTA